MLSSELVDFKSRARAYAACDDERRRRNYGSAMCASSIDGGYLKPASALLEEAEARAAFPKWAED